MIFHLGKLFIIIIEYGENKKHTIKSLNSYTKIWEKKIWKNSKPSLVIIDSQAVKNTDSAKEKWFCHYKCTNWIKRHLLVDVLWFPICVLVTTANIWDREWWRKLVSKNKELLKWVKSMLADHWYASKWFKISVNKITGIKVYISPKPTKSKDEPWFKPVHKRRIVERSNSWMEKCRRLHKNNERYIENSENMIMLCFIRLLSKRLSKI